MNLYELQVLKLYAWESSFGDKIGSIRSQEIHEKTKNRYLDIVNMFCWQMSEFLVRNNYITMFLIFDKLGFYFIILLLTFDGRILDQFFWYFSLQFTFSIFAVYLWLDEGNVLTTKKIYFIMSMISAFRGPLMYMPIAITSLIEVSGMHVRLTYCLNSKTNRKSSKSSIIVCCYKLLFRIFKLFFNVILLSIFIDFLS